MKIDDNWEHNDLPTGLKFSVHKGKNLDVLHIEFTGKPSKVTNRDLYFDKDGKFDGGGTSIDQKCNVKKTKMPQLSTIKAMLTDQRADLLYIRAQKAIQGTANENRFSENVETAATFIEEAIKLIRIMGKADNPPPAGQKK